MSHELIGYCPFSHESLRSPLITQISPIAWRHILQNGHCTFQSDGKLIDLDALVEGLELR